MKPLRLILASVSALSLLAAPATLAAQDAEETVDMAEGAPADEMAGEEYSHDKMAEAMAMLGQMFPAEPLTPEQEARLPQAARIINRMIPEGTMGEMMGSMFDNLLGPVMKLADAPAMAALSKGTGLPAYALDLDPEAAAEASLMVTEKIAAQQDLIVKLATGKLGKTPLAVAANSTRYMLKGVRANRKRLSGRR